MSLLGSAAAVVTDTGSVLAHASLVARELGVPAVVGTGDATARIVDGQRVTVDGDNGTITLDASPGGHVVQVPPSRHGPTSHH
jgi:pyruvate,water dikinase